MLVRDLEFLKNMFHIRLSNANAIILNAEYQLWGDSLTLTSLPASVNLMALERRTKICRSRTLSLTTMGYRDLHQPLRLAARSAETEFCDRCHQRCEIKFFRFEFQATGFDFGKVKDIVNQR